MGRDTSFFSLDFSSASWPSSSSSRGNGAHGSDDGAVRDMQHPPPLSLEHIRTHGQTLHVVFVVRSCVGLAAYLPTYLPNLALVPS